VIVNVLVAEDGFEDELWEEEIKVFGHGSARDSCWQGCAGLVTNIFKCTILKGIVG